MTLDTLDTKLACKIIDIAESAFGATQISFKVKRPKRKPAKRPKSKPAPDAPLTVQQAAKRFNIPARTLYALCADGSLRHSRIGTGRGTIRIKPPDLERLLANGSRKGLLD